MSEQLSGLYQFNVHAPANTTAGDNPVTVTCLGATGPDGMYFAVK